LLIWLSAAFLRRYKHRRRRTKGGSMAYATVMICLALDQPNEARLEAAAQLAERFGPAVIGVAAAEAFLTSLNVDGARRA
jgi:hypothetical protein